MSDLTDLTRINTIFAEAIDVGRFTLSADEIEELELGFSPRECVGAHQVFAKILGEYIPQEEILIVKKCVVCPSLTRYHRVVFEKTLRVKFPDTKLVFVAQLGKAARICMQHADEYASELKRFFNPSTKSVPVNGGPYRTAGD